MNGLTARRQLFVREYVRDYNGTQAARRAGFSVKGAHVEASRLLRNAKVRAALEREIALQQDAELPLRDRVMRDLMRVAQDPAAKPMNSIRALKTLGEILGMFPDRKPKRLSRGWSRR